VSGMAILLGGSLVAVLGLAGIAALLRLGGGAIANEREAMTAAEEAIAGFAAEHAVLGSDGRAALVHGVDGSVVLLKLHGARVAVRHLELPLRTAPTPEGLRIDSGERRFGAVLLRGVSTTTL